jgi:hydrogenase maturation factor
VHVSFALSSLDADEAAHVFQVLVCSWSTDPVN